jgi:hypothetical protein
MAVDHGTVADDLPKPEARYVVLGELYLCTYGILRTDSR